VLLLEPPLPPLLRVMMLSFRSLPPLSMLQR
jgi:hypothetical protein